MVVKENSNVYELEDSNFDFMKLDLDLQEFYPTAHEAERLFAMDSFTSAATMARKLAEALADLIIDMNYGQLSERVTFDQKLTFIKTKYDIPKEIIDNFYFVKTIGNRGSHQIDLDSVSAEDSMKALDSIRKNLIWYENTYSDIKVYNTPITMPRLKEAFKDPNKKTIIYIQTADNESGMFDAWDGTHKIGETSFARDTMEVNLEPNSDFLRKETEKRLNQYMKTSGLPHKTEWAELGWIKSQQRWFGDSEVHDVLNRSGIKKVDYLDGTEWYKVDLETSKRAIQAVKEGKSYLDQPDSNSKKEIVLRDEQKQAVKQTLDYFKKGNSFLWNAKMRFGKTLTSYELIKESGFKKVLVMTHRPVVEDSWFEDFNKFDMSESGYKFGSKEKGEGSLEKLNKSNSPFIYFKSIQDLRDSQVIGGHYDKNDEFFSTDWDLIIVDEAHEGNRTEHAKLLNDGLVKENTKVLELSGTPFNILSDYRENQVFTWDYIQEQEAKLKHQVENPNEVNPYEALPEVQMFTFEMSDSQKFQTTDKYFDFAEFFKMDDGKFVHEDSIVSWLDEISNPNSKTGYPFSTREYRNSIRHTLWMLPSREAARGLKELLDKHEVFKEYNVVNIVNNNDDTDVTENGDDMARVRKAISKNPSETKTILLTVRKLTTGVNIPELNGVVFLNNTTSAQTYLQAAFRAQTPFSDEVLGMKKKAFIFDFAPDRALNVLAQSVSMSPHAGVRNSEENKQKLSSLLNFLPVIGMKDNKMKPYNINQMMRQLKKAFAEKAVLSGFDDASIYNDELWKISEEDAELFNELNNKLGKTKQNKIGRKVVVNDQGLSEEERKNANKAKRKNKKERTPEETELLEKEKEARKRRSNLIDILRGVSIRVPLMIYGMEMDLEEDISINDFIEAVDDVSWNEFMPKGISKKDFKEISRFYDPEIFIEAGHRIRRAAVAVNNLSYQERIGHIAALFGGFRNPDKETVLTPWSVVNLQLGETLGGYNFFDEDFEKELENSEYRNINLGEITKEAFNKDAKILEINSKTGLYPLYMAFTIYKKRYDVESTNWAKSEYVQKDKDLWNEVLENNIFVLNKTPMARTITYRTLIGYEKNNKFWNNLIYVENLVKKLKSDTSQTKLEILEKFGDKKLKFDVVVGNPPYQSDAKQQIYTDFYILSRSMSKIVDLIFPIGWQSPKNANNLSKMNNIEIKEDSQIIFIDNRHNVFSGVPGAEWTNIVLWKKGFDNGLGGKQKIFSDGSDPKIVKLVTDKSQIKKPNQIYDLANTVEKSRDFHSLKTITSSRKPYG